MQLHVHKAGAESIIIASFNLNVKKLGWMARQSARLTLDLWPYSTPRMKWLDVSFTIYIPFNLLSSYSVQVYFKGVIDQSMRQSKIFVFIEVKSHGKRQGIKKIIIINI